MTDNDIPTLRGVKIVVTPPAVADNRQDETIDLTDADREAQRKLDFRRQQVAELNEDRESGVLDVVTMAAHLRLASVTRKLEQALIAIQNADNIEWARALATAALNPNDSEVSA